MANLYGVATPIIYPITSFLIGAGNVACPANTETAIVRTPPLIAISPGYYYPITHFGIVVQYGGAGPGALQFGYRVVGGSDQQNIGMNAATQLANAEGYWYNVLPGSVSQSAWLAPGTQMEITLNPQTNAVTAIYGGSYTFTWLVRAPDQ